MSQPNPLRPGQLKTPELATNNINNALEDLDRRLQALEKGMFFDFDVLADSGGTTNNIVIPKPSRPVKGVYLAKTYDLTNETTVLVGEVPQWELTNAGISFGPLYLTGNTRYRVTVEVRCGT